MEHKGVRVILNREEAAQAPPDVKQEDKLIDWSENVYLASMRTAAAGVLVTEGSLDKAASVLWWAGFSVPSGYFPSGHEANDYIGHDEEPLKMWVEADAENIDNMIETDFFRLAATGRLLDKVEV
jgi:hypothetical protein